MSRPIIEIEGVGKRYRLGGRKEPYLSLREEVSRWFSLAARRRRAADEEFWALRDVSFSVEQGEAVGIIGRNGAGKSTLLKILSQITPPTEGRITMRGRVGSLLEVGTGFHPELTGRENIYMNGAILGMTRREIARKFDEIVAFAEMEKFLDTPVKRYSSGMYVRLAFAVAAHLEPEILIVDEVLAVGDAAFQKKCLGKMGEVASAGRTVLFVSHNMGAVVELCRRAILLSGGLVQSEGSPAEVVAQYLTSGTGRGTIDLMHYTHERSGDGPMRITGLTTMGADRSVRSVFAYGEPLIIAVDLIGTNSTDPVLAVSIRNSFGQMVLCFVNTDDGQSLRSTGAQSHVVLEIPNLSLNDGEYFLTVWLGDGMSLTNDRVGNCLSFTVESAHQGRWRSQGAVRMPGNWNIAEGVCR